MHTEDYDKPDVFFIQRVLAQFNTVSFTVPEKAVPPDAVTRKLLVATRESVKDAIDPENFETVKDAYCLDRKVVMIRGIFHDEEKMVRIHHISVLEATEILDNWIT